MTRQTREGGRCPGWRESGLFFIWARQGTSLQHTDSSCIAHWTQLYILLDRMGLLTPDFSPSGTLPTLPAQAIPFIPQPLLGSTHSRRWTQCLCETLSRFHHSHCHTQDLNNVSSLLLSSSPQMVPPPPGPRNTPSISCLSAADCYYFPVE